MGNAVPHERKALLFGFDPGVPAPLEFRRCNVTQRGMAPPECVNDFAPPFVMNLGVISVCVQIVAVSPPVKPPVQSAIFGLHAATQSVAGLPESAVELGFFEGHGPVDRGVA